MRPGLAIVPSLVLVVLLGVVACSVDDGGGALAEPRADLTDAAPTPPGSDAGSVDRDGGPGALPPEDAGVPDAGVTSCGAGRCAVRVVSGHLERDGSPWRPKGAVITGFVAPPAYLKGVYADAHAAWGPALLAGLRDLGADAVRFNVSVAALDPQNAMPDGALDANGKAAYLSSLKDAVALVEAHGMNAMLTMQTGDVAGDPNVEDKPGKAAKRAWEVLGPVFANDPAVLYIAFNEPGFGGAATIDEDPSPWLDWRDRFAPLVTTIRDGGAKNVIVLDGISTSRVWRKNKAEYVPADPLGQLAYDLHPFPTSSAEVTKGGAAKLDYQTPAHVDHWLDGWCDARPCIATAFFTGIGNNAETSNCFDGTEDGGAGVASPEIVRTFANHFAAKNIGVMAFAADWKNRVFEDPASSPLVPTSFSGFTTCSGPKRMALGKALSALWKTGSVPTPVP